MQGTYWGSLLSDAKVKWFTNVTSGRNQRDKWIHQKPLLEKYDF